MRSRHSVRDTGPYKGCLIAMGTRHQKEGQVAPAFAALLDARVIVPPSLDTDQFGTFTGERPRLLPAIDAARAKASLAMRVAGTAHGLASEATYGPAQRRRVSATRGDPPLRGRLPRSGDRRKGL